MKLIKKLIILYSLVFFLTLIIQSCCKESFRIVGKGDIGAYTEYYNPLNKIDTVKGEFLINWSLELRTASLPNTFGIVQSCYATSCAETFENEILESSFTINCNKDFKYDNMEISAGTNFSDLNNLIINISKKWGGIEIKFPNDFIILADFDKGDYEFDVNISTTDDVEFENKLNIYIDIR